MEILKATSIIELSRKTIAGISIATLLLLFGSIGTPVANEIINIVLTSAGCSIYNYKYYWLGLYLFVIAMDYISKYAYQIKTINSWNIITVNQSVVDHQAFKLISEIERLILTICIYMWISYMWDHCGA